MGRKVYMAAALVGVFAIAAALITLVSTDTIAGGDDEEDEAEGPDVSIEGDALAEASEAALEFTGEGQVTDTEVGDEESYYEVEVTLDNGDQVDVQLDADFNVVGSEAEGPGEEDD
jgi:uncharacterized membrane protein YkoI